jgi:hypothetical protein
MSSSSQKEHLLPVQKDGRPTGHLRRMSSHGSSNGTVGGGSSSGGGNGINIVDSAPPYNAHAPAEKVETARSKYQWLAVYFALNLALTLYNKAVMGKVSLQTGGGVFHVHCAVMVLIDGRISFLFLTYSPEYTPSSE